MVDSKSPHAAKPKMWFKIRIGILVLVLVLFGGVFAYDNYVVKPRALSGRENAQELLKKTRGAAKKETTRITQKEISEAIGREPADVRSEGNFRVETYTWSRGTPMEINWNDGKFSGFRFFPKYYFEVIYKKEDPKADDEDESTEFLVVDISEQNETFTSTVKQTQIAEDPGEIVMPAGGGPGPGGDGDGDGGGGGGGGGGQRLSPDQLVSRIMGLDKDSDGKLSKAEAEDSRFKSRFDDADGNKDGSVSEAEVKAWVKALPAQNSDSDDDGDKKDDQ